MFVFTDARTSVEGKELLHAGTARETRLGGVDAWDASFSACGETDEAQVPCLELLVSEHEDRPLFIVVVYAFLVWIVVERVSVCAAGIVKSVISFGSAVACSESGVAVVDGDGACGGDFTGLPASVARNGPSFGGGGVTKP